MFAVKAGAKGDLLRQTRGSRGPRRGAWPGASSPLVYDGFVYVIDRNGGTISCFDAKTGKAAYTKERIPSAGAFWASPWAADGKIFCLDESGATHVLKAGTEFEVVRVNKLGPRHVLVHPGGRERRAVHPQRRFAVLHRGEVDGLRL